MTTKATAAATLRVGLLLCVASVGCGRKATEADCEIIFDRYVEVQLRAMNVTDLATIEKRKTEMRVDMKDDLHGCVGKRVSDRMIACVKKAETNDEVDKCTRW